MKAIDHKLFNKNSLDVFLKKEILKKFKTKNIQNEKLELVETTLSSETTKLSAKTFFLLIKQLEFDLRLIIKNFFKGLPSSKLKSIKPSKNKLENLFDIYFNSKSDLVLASCLKETRLLELFKNKFETSYAYEICAIAIAFGIEPHLLFNYFYGNGPRPVIGIGADMQGINIDLHKAFEEIYGPRTVNDYPPADAAILNDRTTKVLCYIAAYNDQDVALMLADCAEDIQFINIHSDKVSMHLQGLEAFKQQATEALAYFSERQQTIEALSHHSASMEVRISYTATAAIDLPNGLKKGDSITLKGRSVFEFDKDGKISRLTDVV